MTLIELTDEIIIRKIQVWGGDHMIAAAAKVSTDPEQSRILEDIEETDGLFGLIRYLAKQRHTSPFEHCGATFYVEAPIFVFREWHRHRIASYSEMSGRYTKLMPKFWIPRIDRPLVPVENYKAARPVFGTASANTHANVKSIMYESYQTAWNAYEAMLMTDIAKEVARAPLPVAIYSKMWATTNLHSWLHFLSLRTHNPTALFVSFPQFEINEAANYIEAILAESFPLALRAFNETGRSF
jgi:thymidylate synthase (FAD)